MPTLSTAPPSTIRIFLADGSPDGLWVVTKPNWTGTALRFSRNTYKDVRGRREFDLAGVYVLLGETTLSESQREIYVGEAGTVRERLNTHLSQKDWWTEAVVFVATDDFNISHGKYLEAKLLKRAEEAKRSKVMNAQPMQGNQLGEADRADMEIFFREMITVYPILGVSAFELTETTEKSGGGETFTLSSGGQVIASGQRVADGFLVYSGAIVAPEIQPSGMEYKKMVTLRDELIESGLLVQNGSDLVLGEDYTFSSPSLAAVLIYGRSASGPQSWITEGGKTLKEVEESEAESDETAVETDSLFQATSNESAD